MFVKVIPLLPMFALLVWAAMEDFRTRRIRNWLTLTLVLSGIVRSFLPGATVQPMQAGLGLLLGFALPFAMFALGAIRGGDVKLLAGIGAWLGPMTFLQIFIAEAIVGMVIVLVQCALTGRLFALLRNSAVLAVSLVHIDQLGLKQVTETGQSFRSIDRPLPYAVPVLVATILVVMMLT